jgi:glyoxylase-like metal-dependent hydrolase (beta-lactamase superfamily II)
MPGHTPGSTIINIASGSERAVLLGDTVHHPVELLDDEWAGLGDIDPVKAARVRSQLAREFEDGRTFVSIAHFEGMRFGRLWSGESKRKWTVCDVIYGPYVGF